MFGDCDDLDIIRLTVHFFAICAQSHDGAVAGQVTPELINQSSYLVNSINRQLLSS
jgi:hypothetical protein